MHCMVLKSLAVTIWAVSTLIASSDRSETELSLVLDHDGRQLDLGTQTQESSSERLPSVAIVTLTRNPPDLLTWLKYHLVHVGVKHIFIKSEASLPQLSDADASLGGRLRSRVTIHEGTVLGRPKDDYTTLQHRQLDFINFTQEACREKGIDWLIHIDDDELLYSAQGRLLPEMLAAVPPEYGQVVFKNKEALYDSAKVVNCFRETTRINLNSHAFTSYANGKPGLRVDVEDAHISGPHRWSIGNGSKTFTFDTSHVMLIHYESCPFSKWKDKMWHLSNTSPEALEKIVFSFYRESIKMVQECHMTDGRMEVKTACSDKKLERFWAEHKTAAGRSDVDISPIRIPWDDILRTA